MKPVFMKNIPILFMSLTLCSCAVHAPEEAFTPKLDSSYSVGAHMEYGDSAADLVLTRHSTGAWNADFSAPSALAGVCLTFDGNAVSASYQGLQFTVPKSAMPAKTMLLTVTEVLDTAAGTDAVQCTVQEDGTYRSAGTCEAGAYTLTFDAAGVIAEMEMPDQPMKIKFTEYRVTGESLTTEPAASTGITADTSVSSTAETTTASTTTSK